MEHKRFPLLLRLLAIGGTAAFLMSFPPQSHGQTPESANSRLNSAAPTFSYSQETISFQTPIEEAKVVEVVEMNEEKLPVIRPVAPGPPKPVTSAVQETAPKPPMSSKTPKTPMTAPPTTPPATTIPATPLTPAQPIKSSPSARAEKCLMDENWTIIISPQVIQKRPAGPNGINMDDYDRIYQSIPFRRSEYLANPSYRHDTTMEILTGNPRPTVINRHDTPQRHVNSRPSVAPKTPPGLIFRPYRTSRSADFRFLNPYAPYGP